MTESERDMFPVLNLLEQPELEADGLPGLASWIRSSESFFSWMRKVTQRPYFMVSTIYDLWRALGRIDYLIVCVYAIMDQKSILCLLKQRCGHLLMSVNIVLSVLEP